MAKSYLTKAGKANDKQARGSWLYKWYDPYTSTYRIPLDVWRRDCFLQENVFKLLANGHCYDENGNVSENELAMQIIPHYNEDGELVEGEYDIFIREVEMYC